MAVAAMEAVEEMIVLADGMLISERTLEIMLLEMVKDN